MQARLLANTDLGNFTTVSKKQLPTTTSSYDGVPLWEVPNWDPAGVDLVNICNKKRLADVVTMYLAVSLDLETQWFLDSAYDPLASFSYPSDEPDVRSAMSPMNVDKNESTWYS